jgi:translation initiation factor IF-2
MRVYELAKQLGMENRELIPELKRLGIPVASHSSALDDDSVRVAIEKLSSKARAGDASAGHEGKRAGRAKEHGASHALVHEEPPKPDKKRILIKKKREEGAEEAAALAGCGGGGVCAGSLPAGRRSGAGCASCANLLPKRCGDCVPG